VSRFLGVLLGAVFPPVGVWLVVGLSSGFWINLLLTLLFFVPGQVHALWVIAHNRSDGRPDDDGHATFLAMLFGVFLPPLGVFWKHGVGGALVVNVVLTLLFWFPGQLHALWVIVDEE